MIVKMSTIDFVKSLPVKKFHKDEVLITSDSPSDTFYAIREGYIKVVSIDDTGRQRILWIGGRYDILPLERFFTRKTLQYEYIGFSDGSAYVISKPDFYRLLEERPESALEVARGMSEHLDDILEKLSAAGKSNIFQKILHTLHSLAIKFSSSDEVHLHELGLNLSHQDVADMIGASREAVSVELKKARESGYISYSRMTFTVYTDKIRKELNLLA